MSRRLWIALIISALLVGVAAAQDAKTVVENATKAMGDVKSIQFSGTGHNGALGQALNPGAPWPEVNVTSYTRIIDYSNQSSREEMTRVEPSDLRGGGAPFGGEQKNVNLVSGQFAWNQPGNAPQPAVAAAEERQLQIWLTPHGFLNGAMQNNATAKKGKGGTEVTFTAMGKFKVTGTIDSQGMVTKTETWIPNPVLGDMLVETDYSAYKDFNGVKFPTAIVQKQGPYPVLDLAVTGVQPNVRLDFSIPDAARTTVLPPVKVTTQKLADGVWFLAGGSHNSVLVEYPGYLVMIE